MKNTSIEWCDHTVNFWWGCTQVSPACAHCYAEKFAGFVGKRLFGQEVKWGDGQPRAERLEAARKEALAIQKGAAQFTKEHGRRPRVFINSMSDWLDDQVPVEWLAYLLETLRLCPAVDFLLLTKRPENWMGRTALVMSLLSRTEFPQRNLDLLFWLADWKLGTAPANTWIGTTVEDQERANVRIPNLLEIPAAVRFLSCEPLLGPVRIFDDALRNTDGKIVLSSCTGLGCIVEYLGANAHSFTVGIHWIIAGGEGGQGARPSHPDWFRSLHDQCKDAGVPFLFKQWGEWLPICFDPPGYSPVVNSTTDWHSGKKTVVLQQDGQIRSEFPAGAMTCVRIGKAAAGRLLDGREWNEFPKGKEGA